MSHFRIHLSSGIGEAVNTDLGHLELESVFSHQYLLRELCNHIDVSGVQLIKVWAYGAG